MNILQLFHTTKPLIGVIHLPALPGFADHPGMEKVIEKALRDLHTLEDARFDGALVENDGDHPPHIGPDKEISKHFEKVMRILKKEAHIPLGLEILYDMEGTVQLASKVKADFVRLDVFVDDVETRYGPIIYAEGKKLTKLRKKSHPNLLLFTDIQVKHTTMVDKSKTILQSAKEAIEIGSDGIIITGTWTGKEPSLNEIKKVKAVVGSAPIFVGSGFSSKNAKKFSEYIDGVIVASSIKTGEYIESKKAKDLASVFKKQQKITVAAIGDTGVDIYKNKKIEKPGGIGFNFAYNVMKQGADAMLVSNIGDDKNGKKVKSLISKTNINSAHVRVHSGKTPTQKIILEENGERKFVGYDAGVLKKWKLTKTDLDFIAKQDAIFVPLSDGMKHIFEEAARVKTKAIKVADFSKDSEYADFDKKDNTITKYCKYFDINFVGATEQEKALLKSLSNKYPKKLFILTLGGKGSFCLFQGKEFYQPAEKLDKIVDTTGAGDAFQASFLVSYLQTKDIGISLQKAAKNSVSITQQLGSTDCSL